MKKLLLGIGALLMCAACTNEDESMQVAPQGNAISVELKLATSSDATTRADYAIATEAERIVKTLDAYVFAPSADTEQAYTLEKKYTGLMESDWTPANTEDSKTVTLTGVSQTAKKIFFVANGSAITSLANTTVGTDETSFRALLMNAMTKNPKPAEQPLTMTAETSLAAWPAGSITAAVPAAALERVVARIDLGVKAQEGISFVPTKLEMMSARPGSLVFPTEGTYAEGEASLALATANGSFPTGVTAGDVTLYKGLLFPYEAPATDYVKLVVTGLLTVGDKPAVQASFDIPFADAADNDLAVERNTCYTVTITKINGLDANAEAGITVSDWEGVSTEFDINAGANLKMTAATAQDATTFEAEVAYPEIDALKSTATVSVPTSKEAFTYYLWVGSANIEAAVTNTPLPEGWTLIAPTTTRTEYLWQRSYWTLTIPANTATETKEVTVTATNKLNAEAAVSITFTQEGKVEEADHSKNPLLKWAEADLVYNKNTKTSSIATDYTVQGSLYQWGRNTGWKDYEEAMGSYTQTYQGRFWQYATYGTNYKTGTGIYNGYDDVNDYSYDSANDSFNEPFYFMNPNGTDYWIGTEGGSTWAERANKCGFTQSVCPEGWRMPTKTDFLAITPSSPLSGSSGLSSVINKLVELKKIDNVCSYAIRWSAETSLGKTYLRIDALVVPDDFQESDLSNIEWNTNENVVTRYFGANGFIQAFYHVNIVTSGQIFKVARPMPGVETHVDRLWQNGFYWTVLWEYITDYSVNNDGYYWMSDAKEAFTFNDNARVKNALGADNKTYPFRERKSVLGILAINAQDCCSIRCVKDEN